MSARESTSSEKRAESSSRGTPQTRIVRAADGDAWHLYVNGTPVVTYETFQVCANVEAELRNAANYERSYSEAAEIAAVIRKAVSHD